MAEDRRADGVYEFGDFRLLAAERRLTARNDGRPIELTQKAFATSGSSTTGASGGRPKVVI
jgi:hypothetical protein